MKKFSLLELLHPDGIAHTSLVLGSSCPEILRPELQERFDGNADLFILAPSGKESNSQVWLEAAVRAMSDYLAADGVGYVLVSPRYRWRVINMLYVAGLVIDSAFWHFPDSISSRYLIPMERFPGRFAVDTILSAPSLKRAFALQMFQYSSARWLMTIFWDRVGIVTRRHGARPLCQWLFQGEQRSSGSAIIRRSWREAKGANICYGFSERDALPSVITKTSAVENASSLNREAKVLKNLASEARQAGVQVPKIIERQQNDQHSSLLLSFIPGQSVSDLLALKPDMFMPLMMKIVEWLDRWHRLTLTLQPFTSEQFERTVLSPLNQLTPLLQNVERYRNWLVECRALVVGNPVPLVAAHNDLTMANILFDEQNQMGVVDWETGCLENLPLVDFYYAVTDAVRIAAHCTDWLEAFKACYLPEGPYFTKVVAWREQLQSAIDPSPEFTEICFHACWLHHASNEQQTSEPGEPRPFLEIVQWLASHESKSDQE